MYHGVLLDHTQVHDSAKAWVLGDYLDAVYFKNFAIKSLHEIYSTSSNWSPNSVIGPQVIDYCCAMAPTSSNLYQFILDILIAHWDEELVVIYNTENHQQWDDIWIEHPQLARNLLFSLNQPRDARREKLRDPAEYLEHFVVADEPLHWEGWGIDFE